MRKSPNILKCFNEKQIIGFVTTAKYEDYVKYNQFCSEEDIDYHPHKDIDSCWLRVYLLSFEKAIKIVNFIKSFGLDAVFVVSLRPFLGIILYFISQPMPFYQR